MHKLHTQGPSLPGDGQHEQVYAGHSGIGVMLLDAAHRNEQRFERIEYVSCYRAWDVS